MRRRWSMFPGRFQPFHKGHQTIIDTLLKEGQRVCVAVMDTPINDCNPYSIEARIDMIEEHYSSEIYFQTIKVISIPWMDDVVYGRDVGYVFRKIEVSTEIEAISATKLRGV